MKKLLLNEWKNAHKIWRLRTALAWGLFYGALTAFSDAFSGYFDPWVFLVICAVGYGILFVARYLKEPGLN